MELAPSHSANRWLSQHSDSGNVSPRCECFTRSMFLLVVDAAPLDPATSSTETLISPAGGNITKVIPLIQWPVDVGV